MSYYTDITSPYIWTLLWRGQVPSYHVFLCFTQHVRGKQIARASAVKLSTQSFDRNFCHSALISGLIQSSKSYLSRKEQGTESFCPFLFLRTCWHHKIWRRSCSKAPAFAVLRIEERRTRQRVALYVQSVLWRIQLHAMKCSHALASWTVYY